MMFASIIVSANLKLDNTGNKLITKVIITNEGYLSDFVHYMIRHRYKSQKWKSRCIFAIRLFIDFIAVNKSSGLSNKKLFEQFCSALVFGTIGLDGTDDSELYWLPRQVSDAKNLVNLVSQYSEWLSSHNEKLQSINPFREASLYEKTIKEVALSYRQNNSLLGHLTSPSREGAKFVKNISLGIDSKLSHVFLKKKAFPKNRIDDLLYTGFQIPGTHQSQPMYERLQLRNILITILMMYGGLRVCETMHIYVEDIAEIVDETVHHIVKIYHPATGASPDCALKTRRDYLSKHFGRSPRHEYDQNSRQFAGWKNPLLTNSKGKFFVVNFFPTGASELFFNLWKLYLIHQRVPAPIDAPHPYAFTSNTGMPLSIKAYDSARKRAVTRIGLDYSKDACTTPHADRHRYGQNLSDGKASPLVIKTAMHHVSINSQATYTQPDEDELKKQLESAELILKAKKRS